MSQELIESWHEIVESGDVTLLRDVLSEDVVFHSPVVHTPQVGKDLALMYLSGAFKVLKNESFRYVREVADGYDVVLEFKTEIEGIEINGVDLIRWDESGKIVDFKVMIRPLKAIDIVHQKMKAMLEAFTRVSG